MTGVSALRAVLTGDVVGSTDLRSDARAELPSILKRTYEEVQQKRAQALPYPIDIFSGDSWQIYVAEPTAGMSVALYLRARLRERLNVDVRVALALDRIDFLNPEGVSESDGPAFRRSGRTLSELGKDELMRFVLPERLEGEAMARIAAEGIADLIDSVARGWTQQQAQAVAHMSAGYPEERRQQEVADAWRPEPISQPAVNKHLKSGGWEWIARALRRYEELTQTIVEASRGLGA